MKIEVKNLNKSFKKIEVLKNINITFKTGKIYGFVGRNGSGKSVFLKVLCGLYDPSSGEVLIDGKNIFKDKEFLPNTRAMIDKTCFLPDLSGLENLQLLASIQNKISNDKILEVIDNVNLTLEKDKKFKDYSLGMKQKLNIAQVLMEEPDIMIFDEPFNGVDIKSVKKIKELILNNKKNKIILITSHIKEDIDLADEIYLFDDGNLIGIDNMEKYLNE